MQLTFKICLSIEKNKRKKIDISHFHQEKFCGVRVEIFALKMRSFEARRIQRRQAGDQRKQSGQDGEKVAVGWKRWPRVGGGRA